MRNTGTAFLKIQLSGKAEPFRTEGGKAARVVDSRNPLQLQTNRATFGIAGVWTYYDQAGEIVNAQSPPRRN